MTKFSFILWLIASGTCIGQQTSKMPEYSGVDFFKEEITIKVYDSSAVISGVYFFRNQSSTEASVRILFPFFVDSLAAFPNSIKLCVIEGVKEIDLPFTMAHNAIRFEIPLKGDSAVAWKLSYSQRLKSHYCRYILTTTKTWNKPLESADYKIILPTEYSNIRIWPEPDSVAKLDDSRIFQAHRENFMPMRDLEIFWE